MGFFMLLDEKLELVHNLVQIRGSNNFASLLHRTVDGKDTNEPNNTKNTPNEKPNHNQDPLVITTTRLG
jgi:hypothetical protein